MMEKGLAMGCVLDDGECFTVGCVLNGEGSGDWEKQNFYEEESIYCHRRSVYIYLIKRKKIRFKNKKNADVENCGVSRGFGFIYIYRLHFTHMWFASNLTYLPVVSFLTFYLLVIPSVTSLLPTSSADVTLTHKLIKIRT